jgi:hypothetical protein
MTEKTTSKILIIGLLLFFAIPSYALMPGSVGKAYSDKIDKIFVTTDAAAINQLYEATFSNDTVETLTELALQGRLLMLPKGTRVKALRYVDGGMEVRVLGGQYTGRRVYILEVWLVQ